MGTGRHGLGGHCLAWGEPFEKGDDLCACWKGKVACTSRETRACFRGGTWMRPGATTSFTLACGGCARRDAHWDCGQTCNDVPIMRIVFDFGSSKIRKSEVETLDRLVGILRERSLKVEVLGHADDREGPRGKALRIPRADAVTRYFVQRKVPKARVVVGVPDTDAAKEAIPDGNSAAGASFRLHAVPPAAVTVLPP